MVRVYRIEVDIPEGFAPGVVDDSRFADGREPFVPPRRLYLSKSGAEARAKLLRDIGLADVRVVGSEPVVFPAVAS